MREGFLENDAAVLLETVLVSCMVPGAKKTLLLAVAQLFACRSVIHRRSCRYPGMSVKLMIALVFPPA
jgi:hypothetical protein